ncbi:MAG: HAMP domain-containing sensor histidine kinase, partial [Planctomycetaceae bacterium]|nr:HAMP domain-containing sensor histidine kinase [Planctomycetaceae bacterium]
MTSLEQLQRRIADLELLAYRSAHDLKGPLITLGHFLKGLPASAKAGQWDDFDADIARMSRVLEQSQRMLDDLLQLARLDQPSVTSGPLSIPELVLTAVRQSAAAVQSRGDASYSMGDNWPTILGDESQIVSVFQNLIENAAKFTPDANPDFEFDLGFRREDDRLIVMFRDFGVGIPAADWERVF